LKALYFDPALKKTRADINWRPQIRSDYLTEHFDRLSAQEFVPTQEDILVSRFRTTGQVTTTFIKERWKFELVDLGGQESEREKWEEIFGLLQVNAVIYMVSLDEFDVTSIEDLKSTNLELSMKIFKELVSEERMKKEVAKVLFLNKTDLFAEKMARPESFTKFQKHFPEYQGPNTVTEMQLHIKSLFIKLLDENVPLQVHFTCALDTKAIEVIFDAVRSSIMMSRLSDMGLVL